ncbi:Ankyrin-2 [Symbiodinium microadriaticum]|uniref:Ankyrin-2 n=1 Tax=Symbiodinium microadriaticum TaxID=2951 RepID=A0A1Q9F7P1_SYMMI|nr:Ankyrin-2 [Symbiodinium microadriaticum]
MAGKTWGEAIFGREALCLEVASRLCLSDLAAMLAVCADTAALFREAGASSVTVTEQSAELSRRGADFSVIAPDRLQSVRGSKKALREAVATLSEEVQTLKNERGEKPRKMAAKSDETMEATQAKRALAIQIYESTEEIAKACMQAGIHVTLELGEKNEAYRRKASQQPSLEEKQRPPPRNLASLEPLPPKLYTIGADIGHWVHPHSEESHQFMIIVDEGSRFRAGRILSSGSKQSPNAQSCLSYLQEGWVQYFGFPSTLRLDPAGAFRSTAVEAWCDKHSIYLDIVPGEAHWKIGTVENAVRGIKELMTKLSSSDPDITAPEALAEAIWAFNHREIIRGFSPAQHILGQAPDETGRFLPSGSDVHPNLLVENPSGEFERAAARRAEAEKALAEWTAKQRIMRAQHSKHRPCFDFEPGELVYYWRCQESNKSRRQPGGKHGRFLGPARILATESRQSEDGTLRPGGAVWLVKGRSLLKCSPEQLRRATEREQLLEALATPTAGQTPWTFKAVANEIGGNKYEDISQEVPPPEEWNRAQQVEQEAPPARHRIRGKRPLTTSSMGEDQDMEATVEQDAEGLVGGIPHRERSRSRGREPTDQPTAWWTTVPETKWPEQQASFWGDQAAAVEVEFAFPEGKRGRDRALQDLGAFFVGSMRRRAVELSERRLSPEEKQAFQGAKAVEVKNFVASKAFEILPEHLKPDKAQAIGMRWILTWKLREDGSRKPKARAVLLGYQDEGYEHRATTSPVMTRTTRQALLQLSAWKRWKVRKGDVTGAFLQSRQYPDDLFCIPCPEICESLGIEPGSVTRVKKVSRSSVETIVKANMLLAMAKSKKDHIMKIHSFKKEDTLTMVAWVDAAQGNRADGGSTQGIFLGVSTTDLLEGKIAGVSPLAWTSQKIDRACRSPGASEAQAAVNGEDALYAARFQWSELLYGKPDLHHPDDLVKLTGGCVVTDSRNVYDKLETEVLVIKGAEKRTSIELLAVKESQINTRVEMRWVHSEAQLANSLTKAGPVGAREYELYFRMGHQWRLVEDEVIAPDRLQSVRGDDAVMMDLVCSALSASLSSGLLETLEGLVRSPQYGARPILCHAAASGRPDVVRWMLKNWSSARAFIEPSEPCGASPLHFAALGGHGHVCEVLLEEGGLDVDGRDNSGLRALHLAAEQGHVDACLSLLQCGAHPDGPRGLSDSSCGAPTPLLLAVECGHSEVCALLVTFRADPLASSLDGRTPLAVARKNALGAGSELLATLEAALWPNRARKGKAAETAYVEEESQPVLTGHVGSGSISATPKTSLLYSTHRSACARHDPPYHASSALTVKLARERRQRRPVQRAGQSSECFH